MNVRFYGPQGLGNYFYDENRENIKGEIKYISSVKGKQNPKVASAIATNMIPCSSRSQERI